MVVEASPLPSIAIRGRSVMALVLAPEPPLAPWLEGLDRHMANAAGFFADRAVIASLAAMAWAGPGALAEALEGLDQRQLRLVGVEGIDLALLAGTPWERLPILGPGQGGRADRPVSIPRGSHPAPEPVPAPPPPHAPSLLVEGPIRSGQTILFEDGDVTIVGSVASGAEVMAGGSIHIYGALRGRAIAGIRGGGESRIFCSRLEAEMVAVDHLYRTAENWGAGLHGAAVQIRREQRSLRLSPLA